MIENEYLQELAVEEAFYQLFLPFEDMMICVPSEQVASSFGKQDVLERDSLCKKIIKKQKSAYGKKTFAKDMMPLLHRGLVFDFTF